MANTPLQPSHHGTFQEKVIIWLYYALNVQPMYATILVDSSANY